MKVNIKKLDEKAKIPSYAKEGDACFDLTCVSVEDKDKYIEYDTGLAMEIPKGYVGLIYPRSSVTNLDLMLKNGTGIIDSGYRGSVRFRFWKTKIPKNNGMLGYGYSQWDHPQIYEVGDRVGQMMIVPIPRIELNEVDELSDSDRGAGGYGSTGN